MSPSDFPAVKPSAIAIGVAFNQVASVAVLAPLFQETYQKYKATHNSEEVIKSREAATTAAAWGSSLVGSALQTYGVGALINATGTLSYKGAAYLGGLVFFASAAPGVVSAIATDQRSYDVVAVGVVSNLVETVGLSLVLTYWGTRTNPFE